MASKSGKDDVSEVTDSFSKLSLEERERRALEVIVLPLEKQVKGWNSVLNRRRSMIL